MDDERFECGHTEQDHEQMDELHELVHHVQTIKNPRIALIVTETGEVHFASTIPSSEAAQMLREMTERVRRYGGNYVHDHLDRGMAARWN